jgi:hypothetical protein
MVHGTLSSKIVLEVRRSQEWKIVARNEVS